MHWKNSDSLALAPNTFLGEKFVLFLVVKTRQCILKQLFLFNQNYTSPQAATFKLRMVAILECSQADKQCAETDLITVNAPYRADEVMKSADPERAIGQSAVCLQVRQPSRT